MSSASSTAMAEEEQAVLIRGGPMCEFTVPGAQDTTVLVVGATSRIGRIVVRKLMLRGYNVKVRVPFSAFRPVNPQDPPLDPFLVHTLTIRFEPKRQRPGDGSQNASDPRNFELILEYIKALPDGQETDFILVSCAGSGIEPNRREQVLNAKKAYTRSKMFSEARGGLLLPDGSTVMSCVLEAEESLLPMLQSLSAEIDRIKKENDNMQIELRHLKGEDLNSLQPKELIMIDEALDNGLTNLHEKLMEHWERRMRNNKMLEDENKLLAFKLHQQDVALSGSMRDLELGYHPDRDFAAQMPITFPVQPSHPNLQENN